MYSQYPWDTKFGPQRRLRHNWTLEQDGSSNTFKWKEGIGMPSAQKTPRGTFISHMSFSTFLAIIFRVKPINSPLLTFSILPNTSLRSGEGCEIQGSKRERKTIRKKIIKEKDSKEFSANACLIDTGAVDSSYISLDLAKSLTKLGYEIIDINQTPSVGTEK